MGGDAVDLVRSERGSAVREEQGPVARFPMSGRRTLASSSMTARPAARRRPARLVRRWASRSGIRTFREATSARRIPVPTMVATRHRFREYVQA